MITAKPFQPPIDNATLEQHGPAFAPAPTAPDSSLIIHNSSFSPGCPRCAFPIRRIYAGELICPSCGRRETVAAEFWARIEAACVRGLSGVRV